MIFSITASFHLRETRFMNRIELGGCINKGRSTCVCNIASGLYPLSAAHTNPIWQDPVGQLTLTLYLVMLTRATLCLWPFPAVACLKQTIWLQQGASSNNTKHHWALIRRITVSNIVPYAWVYMSLRLFNCLWLLSESVHWPHHIFAENLKWA